MRTCPLSRSLLRASGHGLLHCICPLLTQSGHTPFRLSVLAATMARLKLGALMRRREFIISVGSLAAWPLAARGQQSNQMRRIGVLLGSYTESDKAGQARIAAFLKALADLGWSTDRNIRIEYRWAAGDTDANQEAHSGNGAVRTRCHCRDKRSGTGAASRADKHAADHIHSDFRAG